MRRSSLRLAPLALLLGFAACRNARLGAPGLLPPPDPSPEALAAEEAALPPAPPARPAPPPAARRVEGLSKADFEEFNRAWLLFVKEDSRWPIARDTWLARGGSAPYVLAENLLRYFMSATVHGGPRHVERVAENAKVAGEPAVAYFATLLVTDARPLPKPVTVSGPDGTKKTYTHWKNDDLIRQQTALVLAAIGPAAVPTLASPPYLRAPSAASRRYVAYALGRIGTDEAVDAVGTLLSAPDWQERGAAVKALGFAALSNERARTHLQRAAKDPDPFVRKKAEEALAGKVRDDV
jgi:hypothetical protein